MTSVVRVRCGRASGTPFELIRGSLSPVPSEVDGVTTNVVQVLDSGMLLYLVPPGATTGPVSVKTATRQATSTTPFVVVP
jgi:hypothetical protein